MSRGPCPLSVFDTFHSILREPRHICLLDGGTGEELFRRGVPDDRKTWSATAVVNPRYHEILREVHRSYINAGARFITTNSYGITPGVGFSESDIKKYVKDAGRIAREAVTSSSSATLVCGSLGPLVESYRPDKIMTEAEGSRIYGVMIQELNPNVDLILAETMSSFEEASQAVLAVANVKPSLPMMISFHLGPSGDLRTGESANSAGT